MRTLMRPILILCLVPFLGAAVCGGKEDKPVCGDGICEKGKGETNYGCSADCPPVCGDGYCDVAHNEKCTLDCGSDTPPPQLKEFYCGGTGPWTCESTSRYAACCLNTFVTCPAAYPYACPYEGGCFTAPCRSTYDFCVYFGQSCSTSGVASAQADDPKDLPLLSGEGYEAEFGYGLDTDPSFSEDVFP